MSEFEDIQRLIRLKRHELPPQDFVEDFVSSLKERHRSELLQGSARGLLWERVTTYFADLFNPKWAYAGATALGLISAVWLVIPQTAPQQLAKNTSAGARSADVRAFDGKQENGDVQRNLISHHYGGGFADEQNVQPVKFTDTLQGGVQTAGFKGDLEYGPAPQR